MSEIMSENEIIESLQESGALLSGHFQLRSKKHSNRFFQAALVFRNPKLGEKLCQVLAARMGETGAETVISPAVGGLIVGQEIARALGINAIFADKDNDQLVLKRGFSIRKGEKIIVAEDVVTEGGRVKQTIELVKSLGGIPVAVAVITDRSGGKVDFDGIPFYSLIKLDLPTWTQEECPMCKNGEAIDVPGSKS
ncbi:MAG: orotate phosphoribosyltransferase [Lentisphaeria bacterium]|nr:orotate phosphoribosyltransferase [Lentisphaeria bacterium]MBR2434743.1 orotate phosphoribosyltransferase [Lentisphaeria bacterium]